MISTKLLCAVAQCCQKRPSTLGPNNNAQFSHPPELTNDVTRRASLLPLPTAVAVAAGAAAAPEAAAAMVPDDTGSSAPYTSRGSCFVRASLSRSRLEGCTQYLVVLRVNCVLGGERGMNAHSAGQRSAAQHSTVHNRATHFSAGEFQHTKQTVRSGLLLLCQKKENTAADTHTMRACLCTTLGCSLFWQSPAAHKPAHLVRGPPLLDACSTSHTSHATCRSSRLCRIAQACVDHRQHPQHVLSAAAVFQQLVDAGAVYINGHTWGWGC